MTEMPRGSQASRPAPDVSPLDVGAATAALAATALQAGRSAADDITVSPGELFDALVLLRRVQNELAGFEPALIAAARVAGVSGQALAPGWGVASRQAAERRYLRSTADPTDQPGATRDARVQA